MQLNHPCGTSCWSQRLKDDADDIMERIAISLDMQMQITPDQVAAGQAIYTRPVLWIYDLAVLGLSNSLIWRCPTRSLRDHYHAYLSANHLDVGVGTGYFLDQCQFPGPDPRILLMDLNRNTLKVTAQRISRYCPETYLHNVLDPLPKLDYKVDSLGLNYLLHCLPGMMTSKALIFDHLLQWMNPGAVLFGSTLLYGGVPRSPVAKALMDFYNSKGIFCNQGDDLEQLQIELKRRFRQVSIKVVGCAALFSGQK
jgi:hypothetical protein